MFEPSSASAEASFISEAEFIKLCDDVYADRHQIYQFNPNAGKREALLWMLLGCLISLLSIPILEQPSVYGNSSSDPYADAINEILRKHMQPPFNSQLHLTALSKKIESEDESEAS